MVEEENDFQPVFKKPSIKPQKSRIKPLAEDTISVETFEDDDEIQFLDSLYKKSTFSNNEIIVIEKPQTNFSKNENILEKPLNESTNTVNNNKPKLESKPEISLINPNNSVNIS